MVHLCQLIFYLLFKHAGHPNARLFITHGGLLSMQESIYHGVPLLTLPFGSDQYINAAKSKKEGCGLKIEWEELDKSKLYNAINAVINQERYNYVLF